MGKGLVIVLACGLCIMCTSCLPTIANLSKGYTVPTAIASHVPLESEILVLPLWEDSRTSNFHNPYVIPVSAIGTSAADVPRRMGFYLDTFACGGPSKYVIGYLVVREAGTVIWSDERGKSISEETGSLKRELKALVMGGEVGSRLRELMGYGTMEIGLEAKEEERAIALRFLEKVPDDDESKHGI